MRLHYSNCKSYNADFDGDEMNAHFPQVPPQYLKAGNPHSFFADPDPAVHLVVHPDPAVFLVVYPDLAAFLVVYPDPAVFLVVYPDPAVFLSRSGTSFKKLCKRLPCEEFCEVGKPKTQIAQKLNTKELFLPL